MRMNEDAVLLGEYVDRASQPAFAALVERHFDLVYSAALRRADGNPVLAREAAYRVFADLAVKAPKLRRHPALAGWLHQGTRWAVARLRRTEVRRKQYEEAAGQELILGGEGDDGRAWAELRPVLDAALDQLNERDREAVVGRYFRNESFGALAARAAISEDAARRRVERALERLRSHLQRQGVTSTAAALGVLMSRQAVSAAPAGWAAQVAAKAGTAVAAGGVAGGLALLLTQTPVWIALAAAVAVGVWAMGQERRLQALEERTRQVTEANARLEAEVKTKSAMRQELETRLKTLAAAVPPLPELTPLQQERKRLDMIVRRGELDFEYRLLFRRLHLSPERLLQLKTLIVERNQVKFDAVRWAKEAGLKALTTEEQERLENSAVQENDSQLATLLGTDGLLEFQRFQRLRAGPLDLIDQLSEARDPELGSTAMALQDALVARWGDIDFRAISDSVAMFERLRAQADDLLTERERPILDDAFAFKMSSEKRQAYVRAAAQQGRLQLSKATAEFYPAPKEVKP